MKIYFFFVESLCNYQKMFEQFGSMLKVDVCFNGTVEAPNGEVKPERKVAKSTYGSCS